MQMDYSTESRSCDTGAVRQRLFWPSPSLEVHQPQMGGASHVIQRPNYPAKTQHSDFVPLKPPTPPVPSGPQVSRYPSQVLSQVPTYDHSQGLPKQQVPELSCYIIMQQEQVAQVEKPKAPLEQRGILLQHAPVPQNPDQLPQNLHQVPQLTRERQVFHVRRYPQRFPYPKVLPPVPQTPSYFVPLHICLKSLQFLNGPSFCLSRESPAINGFSYRSVCVPKWHQSYRPPKTSDDSVPAPVSRG